jgi:hypothetical protein
VITLLLVGPSPTKWSIGPNRRSEENELFRSIELDNYQARLPNRN